MQTYLPYPDFQQSAAALDTTRLGKQRVEALQTLRSLVIPEYGRQSHPVIRMWMGYVPALTMYALAMADEWIARGNPDNTRDSIKEFAPQAAHPDYASKIPMPPWLGDPDFHLSQRSKLLQKDPQFYGEAFAGTPTDLEFLWPEPRHEFLPEDPQDHFVWVLRAPLGDVDPEKIDKVGMPVPGKARPAAAEASGTEASGTEADSYEFVYAEEKHRRPAAKGARKAPKKLVKKPTRNRQRQDEAFRTLPGNTTVLIPIDGGARFALGKIQGRPITLDDGRFGRDFEVTRIMDRSEFDYPALLQDPRVFFPIPAP
ncbi:MSMEG_6728 family protein [Arthrobacter cavernae]|uniref:MSMEG_6728 family protein n=1 Tax=Arthrobacter cavernae TaxID=2817681 RepID=A0A939HG34_9MICC|nr:MSMEG_6728 family protein [Arthrobacter cavernae]MBO1266663.1 MSMEG_6728 family protein [Arthrobacter cavernae]